MRKNKKFILIISTAILIAPLIVLAHQPRLVEAGGVIEVKNPEVSQAFYGELKGRYQDFSVKTGQPISLYVNLLVPDLPLVKTDLSVEIFNLIPATTSLAFLDGALFDWTKFYEPFAGDSYLMGPEFKQTVAPGQYLIRVSSPNYKGKYSLAIGEQESFPLNEIWNTLKVLPVLKKDFFNKSPWTMFFNYIGLSLLFVAAVVLIIVFLAWWGIKKYRDKKYV